LNEHAYELKGGLSQTKNKLSSLKFVEVWEKYSLYGSLGVFCSVSLYIVLKRTRIVVYLFLWLVSLFSGIASLHGPPGLSPSMAPEPFARHPVLLDSERRESRAERAGWVEEEVDVHGDAAVPEIAERAPAPPEAEAEAVEHTPVNTNSKANSLEPVPEPEPESEPEPPAAPDAGEL
jgi:hypothetical protein